MENLEEKKEITVEEMKEILRYNRDEAKKKIEGDFNEKNLKRHYILLEDEDIDSLPEVFFDLFRRVLEVENMTVKEIGELASEITVLAGEMNDKKMNGSFALLNNMLVPVYAKKIKEAA